MSDSAKPGLRRPGWSYRWMMAFLGLFDRWLRLSCRRFVRLASDKHERPLALGERMRQSMHRAMCSLCRIQERHMDWLRALARELGSHAADEDRAELSSESVAKIRRAMAEAAAHRGPSGGSRP